jgi:hypothetical protein
MIMRRKREKHIGNNPGSGFGVKEVFPKYFGNGKWHGCEDVRRTYFQGRRSGNEMWRVDGGEV